MSTRLAILSSYSLHHGTIRAEELFARFKEWGVTKVAITDRDNLYGYPHHRELASEAGVSLICAAALTEGEALIYAFVEDQGGYEELCQILSRRAIDPTFSYLAHFTHHRTTLTLATANPKILEKLQPCTPKLFGALSVDDLGIVTAARRLGIGLLACDGAYLMREEERTTHRLLVAIAQNKRLDAVSVAQRGGVLLEPEAWQRTYAPWPEAIEHAQHIHPHDPFPTTLLFPSYPVDDCANELRERVYQGAEWRYGELNDAILERIDYELAIIAEKGFAPYFLVMHDIVQMSSRSCGRGSAAASIVSYALTITDVDPLHHHLYFERFLSPARQDPPDIDVDFAWDEREAIFERVFERFGRDRCARVANHNFFRLDSAIRETAKTFGLSNAQISAAVYDPHQSDDPLWREIIALAATIVDLPRGLSMHCGGLVMTADPITCHAPIARSVQGQPLLVWEKDGAETAGFVKLDLLGNRSLAVIRDTIANLAWEGIQINRQLWRPAEDGQTIAALAQGASMGVFYIESPAMRQLQKKTGRGDFDHIVIHSSIIRPAANAFINTYIERLKGKPWDPLHPRLDAILDETYGILCYQEDVSKVAVALAGFSEADADRLRKVIAKKSKAERLRSYKEQFYEGCSKNDVEIQTIDRIWEMMMSFDGYSFCKPHSASYAMVSFQSAYLRVHHPAAFMAAVLTNQGGYYEAGAYISEARRMGLTITGPDINLSTIAYHGRTNTLVIGLMAIANLTGGAMEAIIAERKRQGPFGSLQEFIQRLHLGREDLAALTQSGAFDSLAPHLRRSEQLRLLLTRRAPQSQEGQLSLFGAKTIPLRQTTALQPLPSRTRAELVGEYEALGFLREHHPLVLHQEELSRVRRVWAVDIPHYVGRPITLIGHQITRKQVRTKGGDLMSFVSFEDESALYETVLFPHLYQRFYPLLFQRTPLVVEGVVQNDHGALIIEVRSLTLLGSCTTMAESPQWTKRSRYERIPPYCR